MNPVIGSNAFLPQLRITGGTQLLSNTGPLVISGPPGTAVAVAVDGAGSVGTIGNILVDGFGPTNSYGQIVVQNAGKIADGTILLDVSNGD